MSRIYDGLVKVKGGRNTEPVASVAGNVPHVEERENGTNGVRESARVEEAVNAVPIARLEPARPPLSNVRTLALRIPDTAPVLPYDERLRDKGVSEQYRIARTRIVQHPRKPRIVVTTSPGPGDGKTTTALNLAGALALKATENVLLVDADLRRSSVHRVTGLPDRPGLADLLEHRCSLDEALVRTEQFPKLFVLPAGECRTNPAELLNSPEWSALEPVLRARFEHVVLDSPPMSIVADFDLIQAICDGVILVTRPDHTERKLFFRALESVPKDRLIGVVVNCVANWFLKRRVLYDPYHRYPYREKG